MPEWLAQFADSAKWLGVFSIASFFATLIILPVAILQIPEDYFVRHKRDPLRKHRPHPALFGFGVVFKNIIGVVLIIAGAIMVFVPGQGLLTMLIGLMLTNFPGKFHLEQKIIRNKTIFRVIKSLRNKAGKAPLILPDDDDQRPS